MSNYEEWREHAKYCGGQADMITTILELFNEDLPQDVTNWLHWKRGTIRKEAIQFYERAIQAIGTK